MKNQITFEDFAKLDIRIGQITSVEVVEDADKLLRFEFDFGSEKRQIIAGMRSFFSDLTTLKGKKLPVLCNIEPRTFRGQTSHGMIVAADDNGTPVFLQPEHDLPNGSIVK